LWWEGRFLISHLWNFEMCSIVFANITSLRVESQRQWDFCLNIHKRFNPINDLQVSCWMIGPVHSLISVRTTAN
jgi:hypothetical protein